MSDHDARLSDEVVANLVEWLEFYTSQPPLMSGVKHRQLTRALRELQQRRAAGEPVEGRPALEQVEALRLDHAPSTYVEQGWEDAINVVLALFAPDTRQPQTEPK
jgi:hypothetical protein